jgi:hypothetical protein
MRRKFFPCGSRSQSCRVGFTFVDSRQARPAGVGISTEREVRVDKGPENKFTHESRKYINT